jgi:hypothetical protein
MDEVMTELEAAKFLKRGLTTLRSMRRAGKVPHLPGKPVTYLRSSLLDWLRGQEIQPISAPISMPKRSTAYRRCVDKAALKAALLD